MLTKRTAASLVQLFRALSQDAVRLLLIKHLNTDPEPYSVDHLLRIVISAKPDELTGLLIEVVGGSTVIRTDAPTKYVFDGRHADLCGHLRADGFAVVEDSLVRLASDCRARRPDKRLPRRYACRQWPRSRRLRSPIYFANRRPASARPNRISTMQQRKPESHLRRWPAAPPQRSPHLVGKLHPMTPGETLWRSFVARNSSP